MKEKGHEYHGLEDLWSSKPSLKTRRELHYDKLVELYQPHRLPSESRPEFLNKKPLRDWVDCTRDHQSLLAARLSYANNSLTAGEPVQGIATARGPEVAPDLKLLTVPECAATAPNDTRLAILSRMFKASFTAPDDDEEPPANDNDAKAKTDPVKAHDNHRATFDKSLPSAPSMLPETKRVAQPGTPTKPPSDPLVASTTLKEPSVRNTLDGVLRTLATFPYDAEFLPKSPDELSLLDELKAQLKERTQLRTPLSKLVSTRSKPSTTTEDVKPEIFVAVGDFSGVRFQRVVIGAPSVRASPPQSAAVTTVAVQVNYSDLLRESGITAATPSKTAISASEAPKTVTSTTPKAAPVIRKPEKVVRPQSPEHVDDLVSDVRAAPALGQPDPWPPGVMPAVMEEHTFLDNKEAWQAVPRKIPQLVLPKLVTEPFPLFKGCRTTPRPDNKYCVDATDMLNQRAQRAHSKLQKNPESPREVFATIQRTTRPLLQRRVSHAIGEPGCLTSGITACRGGRRFARIAQWRARNHKDTVTLRDSISPSGFRNPELTARLNHDELAEARRAVAWSRHGGRPSACRGGRQRRWSVALWDTNLKYTTALQYANDGIEPAWDVTG